MQYNQDARQRHTYNVCRYFCEMLRSKGIAEVQKGAERQCMIEILPGSLEGAKIHGQIRMQQHISCNSPLSLANVMIAIAVMRYQQVQHRLGEHCMDFQLTSGETQSLVMRQAFGTRPKMIHLPETFDWLCEKASSAITSQLTENQLH